MDQPPLSPHLRDLVERVASYPHGLGFLHLAPLESVAVTLGVSPRVADEARRWMETPPGRARLIAEVRRIRREGAGLRPLRPHATPASAAGAPAEAPAQAKTVEELIARARRHPLGIRFLLRAPLESAAITLEAHPFLVLHARRLLHRRGREDPHANDEDAV